MTNRGFGDVTQAGGISKHLVRVTFYFAVLVLLDLYLAVYLANIVCNLSSTFISDIGDHVTNEVCL